MLEYLTFDSPATNITLLNLTNRPHLIYHASNRHVSLLYYTQGHMTLLYLSYPLHHVSSNTRVCSFDQDDDAVATNLTFNDREASQSLDENLTDISIVELVKHIKKMPDSHIKRKTIKKVSIAPLVVVVVVLIMVVVM